MGGDCISCFNLRKAFGIGCQGFSIYNEPFNTLRPLLVYPTQTGPTVWETARSQDHILNRNTSRLKNCSQHWLEIIYIQS